MVLWPQDHSQSMARQEGYKDSTRQEDTEQNGEGHQHQTQQENLDTNQTQSQIEKKQNIQKNKKYGEMKGQNQLTLFESSYKIQRALHPQKVGSLN